MLACVGLSHKEAPIGVRERIAIPKAELPARLARLRALPGVREAILLSTCNRLEIFAEIADRSAASDLLEELGPAAAPHARIWFEADALEHLFRVASALESMVVGEAQILGQLKSAAALAESLGTLGPSLGKALERATVAARRVRGETAIGKGAVSLSSVAVQTARKILGELAGKSVLLIGAGEMAQLAARELHDDGASEIWVANRSPQHAEELAREIGGSPLGLAELPAFFERVDVVLCSAYAPEPIVTRALVERALHLRRHRPLFVIDLAVPRNVDPHVNDLEGVYLYDLDDLQRVGTQNLALREAELARAAKIIREEMQRHESQSKERTPGALVPRLRALADAIAEAELARTASLSLTDAQQKAVRAMAKAIVNKLLHAPTANLRGDGDGHLTEAAEKLFGLGRAQPARSGEVIQLRSLA